MVGPVVRRVYQSRLVRELYVVYLFLWMIVTSRLPLGTNVFERDWDVLIVLDACRVDAMEAVADEYEFIGDIERLRSLGSTSKEWMGKTFTRTYADRIAETEYVCSNPYMDALSDEHLDFLDDGTTRRSRLATATWANSLISSDLVVPDEFAGYQSLWANLSSRSEFGVAEADDVTDYAIRAARDHENERLIVHYMQPHAPYIGDALAEGRELREFEEQPFEALRKGTDRAVVWEAYLNNLRYVLDHVERFLRNVDADRVVLSSDHGELFGEYGLYAHGVGIPHPGVKHVPWVETSAENIEGYEPTIEELAEAGEVQEHLSALGYL